MDWYNFGFMSVMTSFSISMPAARQLKKGSGNYEKIYHANPLTKPCQNTPHWLKGEISIPACFCHFVNTWSSDSITVGTLMFLLGSVLRLSSSVKCLLRRKMHARKHPSSMMRDISILTGATILPVCPTCMSLGTKPASTAAREAPTSWKKIFPMFSLKIFASQIYITIKAHVVLKSPTL